MVTIIQPPLVQLNTAYPSGAYLSGFFKNLGFETKWHDLSIGLLDEIFCREGIERIFELTESKALELADKAFDEGDEGTASNLRNYIYQKDLWISSINTIISILRDGGSSSRELCHKFIFSPFTPRGMRSENYLASLEGLPTCDDARNLASALLEDFADYIAYVFDREFSLVRYAESIAVSEQDFSDIEAAVDSPMLAEFYQKVLDKRFSDADFSDSFNLVLVSMPFAGTFAAALYTGRYFKQRFGNRVFVSFGGGFANTELRLFNNPSFRKYGDSLSFDRGYGSYKNLLDSMESSGGIFKIQEPIYKMRLFLDGRVMEPRLEDGKYERYENEVTCTTVPDYSDIDFSLYPRMADDTNPMQRLWSDGAWMKAYLAHGCYWHKCAFCDVTLDYVSSYKMTAIGQLYDGLYSQSEKNGIKGIHFVDEAMPLAGMMTFSKKNISAKNSFSYWGNIRFEKTFTREKADFLSYGGLTGVSGGIEIATGSGLDKISKGTDLESIVAACCALKEAGVLIHAYMIFGYFGETEQDTINSMETLRQFFEFGLLDSCFWHKFVLTRHSRIYKEWQEGKYPELKPIEPKGAGLFSSNGLHLEGERKYERYSNGLNASLQSWMHGEKIEMNVTKWFDFKVCQPSVPKTLVSDAVAKYEEKRDSESRKPVELEKSYWLAGNVVATSGRILWKYMGEEYSAKIPKSASASDVEKFVSALRNLNPKARSLNEMERLLEEKNELKELLQKLRGRGLVCV